MRATLIRFASSAKAQWCLACALTMSGAANVSTADEHYYQGPAGFFANYKAAEAHDPKLRQARHNYEADRQEDKISRAALLPAIQASAYYQHEDSDNIYTDEDSSFYDENLERSGGELDDHSWSVTLRQPLFDYSALKEYQSTKAFVLASGYNFQRERQELVYRVSEQFLEVLLAAQEVYLNRQKLEALELKLVQVERAEELAISDQLAVLHARANRDIARSDLLQAESNLSDHETLLSNITGRPVTVPQHWVSSDREIMPDLELGTLDSWLKAVTDNMDVKAAVARREQERLTLAARKGDYLPKLSLNLSHRDRDSEDDFRTRTDTIAAIEFSMPIYSGGLTSANARKARARLMASQAELTYIRDERLQQIRLSYNRISSSKERLLALAKSRESSKGYLEAAERQQSLKLNDQVNVLDAQTQLLDTQIKFAQALNDYLLSDLSLRLETGRLTPHRLHDYDNLFSR